jgi:hypothetical protein
VRTLGLLGSLLFLLQCGPELPDEHGGSSDSSGTSTTAPTDPTSGTATSGTTSTTQSTTTSAGQCQGTESGHGWTCTCTTDMGPWLPFNDACDKQESGAVEWVTWLCEEYADEPTTDTTTADITTGEDTGSLGCKCSCTVTDECCDDSVP